MSNTKSMVCTPGLVWGQQVVESYKGRATGEVPTFWERKITRVSCEECGGGMSDFSLRHHMERSHGIVLPQVRGRHQRMRYGYLQGFVPADSEVSGVPCGVMPGKGKDPGNTEGEFHVLTLEVNDVHHAGGAGNFTAV